MSQYIHQREKKELQQILARYDSGKSDDLLAVLDTFLSDETHQTASDLHRRLRARGLQLTLPFVQQALNIFCQLGFACCKRFEGQEPVYEHQHLGHHHDHLICTRCGRVEEFVNPQIEDLQSKVAQDKGFVPLQHRMEIYGLCGPCSEERGTAVPLCDAEPGERLIICGHIGGAELNRRLNDMGLNTGAEVEVLARNSGPIILACRGSRLALGRGMSKKIMVTSKAKSKTD